MHSAVLLCCTAHLNATDVHMRGHVCCAHHITVHVAADLQDGHRPTQHRSAHCAICKLIAHGSGTPSALSQAEGCCSDCCLSCACTPAQEPTTVQQLTSSCRVTLGAQLPAAHLNHAVANVLCGTVAAQRATAAIRAEVGGLHAWAGGKFKPQVSQSGVHRTACKRA